MPSRKKFDVAIVGAGPTGLSLATVLARNGIAVVVLEASPHLAGDPRASTFHPPTLEMLAAIGAAQPLIDQGVVVRSWEMRLHPDNESAVFDMSVLDDETPFPFRLQCEQANLTRLLHDRNAASATPFDLRFGARVTDVVQTSDDAVAVTCSDAAGGVDTVIAAVCVGADGAGSAVRKQLGFAFEGSTYPEMSVIATTDFPFQDHMPDLRLVSYCWSAGGRFTLLKVRSHWRVSLSPRAGLTLAEATDRELIESQLQAIVPTGTRYDVSSIRGYSSHLRMVDTYRRGRIVLMGDAAHLHSSAGGTGMNGGIHDAFALADCLVEMFKAGASDAVLDRYEAVRRPVTAAEVIPLAMLNRARTHEKDFGEQRKILADMQAITADRGAMKAHLLRTSMIQGVRMSKQAMPG